MSSLGVQHARSPAHAAQRRGRYFNSANAFNVKLGEVPAGIFVQQARAAMAPGAATGYYACDQSTELGCPYPATTPLMLARYARIRAGATLHADFNASGSIWYVIAGNGTVDAGNERFAWRRGDVLHLPPGHGMLHADSDDAILWLVTDEPLLAHLGLQPAPGRSSVVHFGSADIAEQIEQIQRAVPDAGTSGMAVVFSCERQEAGRNLMADLTLSLNTLPAGASQSPHRHNSAALTLVVAGEQCHSQVGGARCPWEHWATLVTPAGVPHSHHNGGSQRADFLIVQDGGLYYQARTMGFEFLDS